MDRGEMKRPQTHSGRGTETGTSPNTLIGDAQPFLKQDRDISFGIEITPNSPDFVLPSDISKPSAASPRLKSSRMADARLGM